MGWGGRGRVQVGIPPSDHATLFSHVMMSLKVREQGRQQHAPGAGKREASWGINHSIKNQYCRKKVNIIINNFAVILLFFIVLFSSNFSRSRQAKSCHHRINMELNLQGLFGLHAHSWLYSLAETLQPPSPAFGLLNEGAIAIGRPR
jgi:hypothetical protein